ncbi:hypothetical protein GIB67_013116 [Kingdonia uniflora]|uniref:Uncharacterized protein n=1 Tax=Kingdonia uniflora TaxID=39325 RepID=A0A7J7NP32_9MAGN|nr:hypothetical protein GIB67_013116 [Kingdonia uniflora]
MMIDTRSTIELLFQNSIDQMKLADKVQPSDIDIFGFNGSRNERVGKIILPIMAVAITINVVFYVINLSIAWKSAAEVLKIAAADRSEYEVEKASLAEQLKEQTALCEQLQKKKVLQRKQFERENALQKDQIEKEATTTKKEVEDEAKKVVDIVVASRNKLIQAFYFWGLSREDVYLALAGKYSKIIFPGDDTSPVAEQSPASPVADDTTKEEAVCLRGKVNEKEKALSRAMDSINRTQQVHNKLKYERRLHKSNFDNTFNELFELQCRYGKIQIERDEVLRKESDRFALLQKSLKDKRFVDESDKLECQRSLLCLTLYFEAEVDSERGLKETFLELLTERGIVPDPARGQRAIIILFFNIKKEDRRVQAQLENDLRHARDELKLCKDHNACLEMEMVECNKLLQSSDKRVTLLEARLLDTQKRFQMSQSRLKKYLTPKQGKRANKTDHERQIADVIEFYGGELERVENEFKCYILSCG